MGRLKAYDMNTGYRHYADRGCKGGPSYTRRTAAAYRLPFNPSLRALPPGDFRMEGEEQVQVDRSKGQRPPGLLQGPKIMPQDGDKIAAGIHMFARHDIVVGNALGQSGLARPHVPAQAPGHAWVG